MLKRFVSTLGMVSALGSFAYGNVSQSDCETKGDDYLFAGGECIQFSEFEGDGNEKLILVIHGSWKAGTNTLGRYAPFAETLNMNTDITTVAVALPGYSKSSSNAMPPLEHDAKISPSTTPSYIEFLGKMVKAFKDKYEASEVTYVGHSAGARMGATLSALQPGLIQNAVLAGGGYETKPKNKGEAVSFMDVMDKADKNTNYLLIYGTKDTISPPKVSIKAYEKMKDAGFKVKIVEVKDAPHLDLDMTDTSINAITEMLEEE